MTKEKPFKKIIDALTGEETIIELTAEEIAELEEAGVRFEAQKAEEDAIKADLEARKLEVLSKLGLTPDEVTALLA
jgi:antitoxin component of RelBE/YafQ-DinJ toxin-antitoxin module